MNQKLIRKLSIRAMSDAMNIDAHKAKAIMEDVDKMYIPDCYRDRLVRLVLEEALKSFQRPDTDLTQFECMADDYASNAIKRRFGLNE